MTSDCVLDSSELTYTAYSNTGGIKKIIKDRYKKNTYIQIKGQCKDRSTPQKNHISSCTVMIPKQVTLKFTLTCCRLNLIYCPYCCIMLTIRSLVMKPILR